MEVQHISEIGGLTRRCNNEKCDNLVALLLRFRKAKLDIFLLQEADTNVKEIENYLR